MDAEQVRGCQGLWRAAIYNPMHIYKISYNLTVSRTAACLNNCSQHGTCTADGLCHCEGDWCGTSVWAAASLTCACVKSSDKFLEVLGGPSAT